MHLWRSRSSLEESLIVAIRRLHSLRIGRFGSMSVMAKISGQYPGSCLVRDYIFFQLYFSSGGGAPLPAMILAGRNQRRNPCEVRSTLSQFPSRRTSLPPTGRNTATSSSYADARFVSGIRSLVMVGALSRRTTSITTGFGSIAVAALIAG